MLTFSQEGAEADRQMQAVIFYLTTFGYIDGDFDKREQGFVKEYIAKLVEHRVAGAIDKSDVKLRAELTHKFTSHFHEVFEGISRQVAELFTEAVSDSEDQEQFVHSKLKLRCFEIFKSFDAASQELLMSSIDELIHADGEVHPAEVKFRAELAELLEDDLGVELIDDGDDSRARVALRQGDSLLPPAHDDPFLEPLERHYSKEPHKLAEQMRDDLALVEKVTRTLEDLRFRGSGKLGHKKNVSEFAGSEPFLDGHIFMEQPKPGQSYELTIVGDLHGCYSCLKAVLMQSRFFEKLAAYRKSPATAVCPKLVLLGDYIDRGMFSYQGVLRGVMQLLVEEPEHVYLLRGNHEYYFRYQGRIYGGVKPAEAINTLKPHVPNEGVFEAYMAMFENLPNMLFFEKFLFVHGGIARDRLLKERFTDLASLNDPDIRFQMMWSDPSSVDVIPAALQEQSARFPFGKLQCQAFLQKVGCHTLVRGHEKVDEGFRVVYDEDSLMLISLFSAGGANNLDLPKESAYRSVTPMAMTLRYRDGHTEIVPWRIHYEAFNDPSRNAFFRASPEIAHQVG
jgi:hypothetical protein